MFHTLYFNTEIKQSILIIDNPLFLIPLDYLSFYLGEKAKLLLKLFARRLLRHIIIK